MIMIMGGIVMCDNDNGHVIMGGDNGCYCDGWDCHL